MKCQVDQTKHKKGFLVLYAAISSSIYGYHFHSTFLHLCFPSWVNCKLKLWACFGRQISFYCNRINHLSFPCRTLQWTLPSVTVATTLLRFLACEVCGNPASSFFFSWTNLKIFWRREQLTRKLLAQLRNALYYQATSTCTQPTWASVT